MTTIAPDKSQPSLLDALAPAAPREALVDRLRREERARVTAEPSGATVESAGVAEPSGATLEDLISGAWSSLELSGVATCPVCSGDVAPRYGSGARPVAGACRSCGTELS